MKFIHFADTHLGRSAFNRVNPETGENLREEAIYANFLQTIEEFISMKPDFVIHSGDLFDTVKPKNRAFVVASRGIRMLEDADIPLYAIAGNHSMIKTRHTASPFSVLQYGIRRSVLVHEFGSHEITLDDCCIHMIPNMHHKEQYNDAFSTLQPDPNKFNVLVMHGLVSGIKDKRLNTTAELDIDPSITLSDMYDYKALGHYHHQDEVSPGTWYSGSLECLTYGEIDELKGAMMVTNKEVIQLNDLPRTQTRSSVLKCADLTPQDITNAICSLIEEWKCPNGMGQVTLIDLTAEKAAAIDHAHIGDCSNHMLNVKLKRVDVQRSDMVATTEAIQNLDYSYEYEQYIKSLNLGREEELVIIKGKALLKEAL